MEISFIILFLFLLIYEPIVGYFSYQRFRNKLALHSTSRVPYYIEVMAALWAPTLFIIILIFITPLTFMDIGFSSISLTTSILGKPVTYIVWTIFALYIGMYIYHAIAIKYSPSYRRKVALAKREQLKKSQSFADILPVTEKEKKAWKYVSFTAGFTEEVLYRGFIIYVLFYFMPNISIWLTLIFSALVFGLAHTYQGVGGVVRTGIIGLLFGMMYVTIGSILPLIVLHFLIDWAARAHDDSYEFDLDEEEECSSNEENALEDEMIDTVFQKMDKKLFKVFNSSLLSYSIAREVSMYYYFFTIKPPIFNNKLGSTYTIHKRNGYLGIMIALLFVILLESAGLFYLLHKWSPIASWIHLLLNVYGFTYLISDYKAITRNPILLTNKYLYINVGLRKSLTVPISAIQSIQSGNMNYEKDKKRKDIFKATVLDMDTPDYEIGLKHKIPTKSFTGTIQYVEKIYISIDEREAFFRDLTNAIDQETKVV
ncbi:CPBP family intramembrane metalloprotease [Bacillus luteolus]|uniref:CPBP family intramembrane metalloprotease n=1 Tax=Litchfieldia luteola TaxID=682179 RepID=A0ABR9QL41_9BACI|nr:CPBP family intramembrane glutamic endopeptidase [Cytobacillus luteolus]MBE4909216.1 CPBP family intramembrane metalloprotease [Cytobacillus luteolus]MBP1940328.1 membrane protease YdiL (CAAX protease family) [Cytobacillus luteolus]